MGAWGFSEVTQVLGVHKPDMQDDTWEARGGRRKKGSKEKLTGGAEKDFHFFDFFPQITISSFPVPIFFFDQLNDWRASSRKPLRTGLSGSGVLRESALLGVTRHIPRRTLAEDLDALRAGMRLAASRGIASVQDAGEGLDQLPVWRSLRESGDLTLRVRLAFDMTPGMETHEWVKRLDLYDEARRDGDRWISTGILKAFADGVVESKTAALLEPYADSDERGDPLWGPDELRDAVRSADARGWQVQIHAIGDAAIRQALDALEGTTPGRRHRVEHIEAPLLADIARFGQLRVIASMQPQHSDPKLTAVWRRHLGPERAARGWPWREILHSGGRLAFGTDWPVVPIDPFASLACASGLSRDEALAAWTHGSAYAEHADAEKGEIREGMLADIAVVDLERESVQATIVGGRIVYEA